MFSFSISTFSESTVISRRNPNVLSTVFTNEKGEMLVGQPCHVNKVTSEHIQSIKSSLFSVRGDFNALSITYVTLVLLLTTVVPNHSITQLKVKI